MTGLRLHPDTRWVQVDLAAPPRDWAADTVRARWAAQRLDPDPRRAEVITAGVARVVASLDLAGLGAALLFYPAANQPVVTVVCLRAFSARPEFTLDALGAELSMPEEVLERPCQRSVVETPAGPAMRLVQRYREPLDAGVDEIREHIAYGWLVADHDHTTVEIASTTFVDLVAAGVWITAIDTLARSATL